MRLVSLKVSQTSQYRKRIIQFNNNKKNVYSLIWIGLDFFLLIDKNSIPIKSMSYITGSKI